MVEPVKGVEYKLGYQEGFTRGMAEAATRFPLVISVLATSLLLKIIFRHPKIQSYTGEYYAQIIVYSTDVLAFVCTCIIVASYFSVPLV